MHQVKKSNCKGCGSHSNNNQNIARANTYANTHNKNKPCNTNEDDNGSIIIAGNDSNIISTGDNSNVHFYENIIIGDFSSGGNTGASGNNIVVNRSTQPALPTTVSASILVNNTSYGLGQTIPAMNGTVSATFNFQLASGTGNICVRILKSNGTPVMMGNGTMMATINLCQGCQNVLANVPLAPGSYTLAPC